MVPVFVKSGGAGALGVGRRDTGSPIGDSDEPSHTQCSVKAFPLGLCQGGRWEVPWLGFCVFPGCRAWRFIFGAWPVTLCCSRPWLKGVCPAGHRSKQHLLGQ